VVHFKDFSLMSPMIQSNDLLKAIETAIPVTAIEQAIATSKASEERNRSLPAHVVICLLVAMSFSPLRFNAGCTEKPN
jgi:hypothetical protein